MGELPALLKSKEGRAIESKQWPEHRESLVNILAENQFGFYLKSHVH